MSILETFTNEQKKVLFKNGKGANSGKNHIPVVELKVGKLGYRFLITELDPQEPQYAFGLCDYNTDLQIGLVNLLDLERKATEKGAKLEIRSAFTGKYNLAVYCKAAFDFGTIIEDPADKYGNHYLSKYNKGKNCDFSQDVRNLRKTLSWQLK